jgi:hypothetical protein
MRNAFTARWSPGGVGRKCWEMRNKRRKHYVDAFWMEVLEEAEAAGMKPL